MGPNQVILPGFNEEVNIRAVVISSLIRSFTMMRRKICRRPTGGGGYSEEEAAKVEERLKALGYIE